MLPPQSPVPAQSSLSFYAVIIRIEGRTGPCAETELFVQQCFIDCIDYKQGLKNFMLAHQSGKYLTRQLKIALLVFL
jgi:hypothetical protein